MTTLTLSGTIVDVVHRNMFPGTLAIADGQIQSVTPEPEKIYDRYILPGFVDAHVHIESSMLVPTEFARLATVQGTVAAVSDPHEIANVLGLSGVRFMLANAAQTPFEIAFGAPSCVPATSFETAGATLSAADIRQLIQQDGITYLSEVMNVPGVLARAPEVMEKIQVARRLGLPVDGHSPGLRGEGLKNYAAAHITTDHECYSLEEALDKLDAGMKVLIREGSAAKNFEALHSLIENYSDRCMFCSDDKHPDDLVRGHINEMVQRAVALGHNMMDVLQVACLNPVSHYGLNVGLLQMGDPADAIVVQDLRDFEILQTYCKGILVAEAGKSLLPSVPVEIVNAFAATEKQVEDFVLPARGLMVRAIEAIDGQLVTGEQQVAAPISGEVMTSDVDRDLLKIAVVNRYANRPPAVAFVTGFGLKRGAIASSVAHDSHNIVAVGVSDRELCAAVNAVTLKRGGIALVEEDSVQVLPLPIAGLMSTKNGYQVATEYAQLDSRAKELGSSLTAPFMMLSFMALLVIPDLKLSDRGLFSGKAFEFVPLCI